MARRYILDTHALVRYLEGNPRLGAEAKAVIDDPHSQLVLPLIALAEAAFIVEQGRSSIPGVSALLNSVQSDARVMVYPMTLDVFQQGLTVAGSIPELHDRFIVGTALHLQSLGDTVSILTKDRLIAGAGLVSIVW